VVRGKPLQETMLISQKTSEKTAFNQTNKRKIIQVGKKVKDWTIEQ